MKGGSLEGVDVDNPSCADRRTNHIGGRSLNGFFLFVVGSEEEDSAVSVAVLDSPNQAGNWHQVYHKEVSVGAYQCQYETRYW